MAKLIIALVCVLICLHPERMVAQFTQIKPDSTSSEFEFKTIEVEEAIWIDEILLISGIAENDQEGIQLFVMNGQGETLFESKGQQDSWRMRLKLFKSQVSEKLIVFGEVGTEESWGVCLFQYESGEFKELGFLDVVGLNEYGEAMDITPFLTIEELDVETFKFGFKDGIKVFDNKSEKTYAREELYFSYAAGKLEKWFEP